eukprot:CAMPEP_0174261654 /NCGR_PEP_ID=MMETSP0439-20130205/11730_1 /TAXON_ID=0 /ORGANISM="Stereomyxa ramosa, Strain Chinc5" /LENGTH=228 /DNA_ID=CAMNT_0015346167 /DNA_START=38 /DNA_END=724 /DNA_ORIENTATION=+
MQRDNTKRRSLILEDQPVAPQCAFTSPCQWLVAIDGSANSTLALFYALQMMHAKDKLLIVHCMNASKKHDTEAYEKKAAKHKGLLSYYAGLVRKFSEDVNFKTELVECMDAREAIVEEGKRVHADCIVMGHRGRGLVSSLLLGSVSAYVVVHAECAVTVVRESEEQKKRRLEEERMTNELAEVRTLQESQTIDAERRQREKARLQNEILELQEKLKELSVDEPVSAAD